jgi:hypothetical protein
MVQRAQSVRFWSKCCCGVPAPAGPVPVQYRPGAGLDRHAEAARLDVVAYRAQEVEHSLDQ